MIYDGGNGGTVELLDDGLVIRRKGVASFLSQGLQGEKRIPFSSITSIQFKEPGITTGYIQFGLLGGVEKRGGVFDATKDENTVLFVSTALGNFRRLREIVESKIGQAHRTPGPSIVSSATYAEELTRLADLRDRGVLSDEEFGDEKARLQSQRNSPVAQHVRQSDARPLSPKPERDEALAKTDATAKSTTGKKLGIGCLVILAILFGLGVLGASLDPENQTGAANGDAAANEDMSVESSLASKRISEPAKPAAEVAPSSSLTAAQNNAVRSAEQYLAMTGFSRDGLIAQLSSDAGEGYSVDDATVAVDSLGVDWNENAVKSAKQYLNMTGFSCKGLIEQLSSSAGEKYTSEQASYGARQAGAC